MKKICILIPVFNDWESLNILLEKIKGTLIENKLLAISIVIVDDCSTENSKGFSTNTDYTIINLTRNLGHQKAIAIGLSYISDNCKSDFVIVMDSDGEDKPEDIDKLITASQSDSSAIFFAQRTKRQEGIIFKLCYKIYKFIFSLLTGKRIAFGNFCIIPYNSLKQVTHVSEIWNHFSGAIIKSKMVYKSLPLERGKRLKGESKMNFSSLVLHGLSAIAVHIDTVAVRLLIFTFSLIILSVIGIFAVSLIKFFTTIATPGWATTIVFGLLIIIIQAFMISLSLLFVVLTYRAQRFFIPAIHYKDYILNTTNGNQ